VLICGKGVVVDVVTDDDIGIDVDNDGPLLLLILLAAEVEDVLLGTVRDELLMIAVVVVNGNDIDMVVAMVIGIVTLELTLCDLVGALRGDGGT